VTVTTVGQFILVFNVLCLHTADFAGLAQVRFLSAVPRMLTFGITFALWLCYLPVAFLNAIFVDLADRRRRPAPQPRVAIRIGAAWIVGTVGIGLGLCVAYTALAAGGGFASAPVLMLGKTTRTIATCLVVVQYVPQMVTTCRLRGPASLSVALMAMQAPGGTLNALFMWLAQSDHWTTWISIEASSVQMFILLAICAYFKFRAWREKKARKEEERSLSGGSEDGEMKQRLLNEVAAPPDDGDAQPTAEAQPPPVVFVDHGASGEPADGP
jgi:hypothetical protein